jgi:hypothetical protein
MGLPVDYFGRDVAAPNAQHFGGYGAPAAPAAADAADDDLVLYQAPSPTQGMVDAPAAAPGTLAGDLPSADSGKGSLISKGGSSKASSKGFPASSWLKSLHLPGKSKNKNKAAALAATATLAHGGFSPLSAAAGVSVLSTNSSAVDHVAVTGGTTCQGAGHSRSNSRTSGISLAAGGRRSASAQHSPAASEGSSVIARNAAAEIARAAVAAVVERAAREEHEISSIRQHGAAAAGFEHVPHRSHTSSPETWSYTSSVPARPHSAITASAASGMTTQATLKRLLGFEEDPANLNVLGKVRLAPSRGWSCCLSLAGVACRLAHVLASANFGLIAEQGGHSVVYHLPCVAAYLLVCTAHCHRNMQIVYWVKMQHSKLPRSTS